MAKRLVKVRFPLNVADWHARGGEFLWASPISDGDGTYRIENTPYFTPGVSFRDVVSAKPTGDAVVFEFDKVVERGGNSTYMILVDPEEPRFETSWSALASLGCSYESMEINLSMGLRLLFAVDVPTSADLREVRKLLSKGEVDGVWMFQHGYVSQR